MIAIERFHVHDVRVAHHAAEELCVFCLTQ